MEKFIDTSVWVPVHTIPGFESAIEYYVNREGEVLSTKGNTERILKHKKHKAGYPMVTLMQRIGRKKPIYVCVHKLVAFAFLGQPPTPYGAEKGCSMIDHIDEDKTNCNASNLRWVTRRENNTKCDYQRRLKNTPEQQAAAKERQRIAKRDYMRRKRAAEKKAKME
nr:hypothetical protein 29 [Paracoccaceae bacterium]